MRRPGSEDPHRRQRNSLIQFLKLKYYGNFTYITQIVHSDAHLNAFKTIFSDKLIKGNLNFQFTEILNSQEICPWKVLNFSRVCFKQTLLILIGLI